jgi:hypothetical protein
MDLSRRLDRAAERFGKRIDDGEDPTICANCFIASVKEILMDATDSNRTIVRMDVPALLGKDLIGPFGSIWLSDRPEFAGLPR